MGSFKNFKTAKAARGPIRRFDIGNYRCKIDTVKFDESRKKVEFFAVGFTVVALHDPESKMKVNDSADWSAMSDWDGYEGLVKDFIAKAFDTSEQEINDMSDEEFDDMMNKITGTDQIACGRLIDIECVPYENKEGKDTTVIRLKAVPDDEQPVVAEAAA